MVGGGAFVIVIGRRMRKDQIRPNELMGTRTPYAMESEENWYRVQRATATPALLMGCAILAAGVIASIGAVVEYVDPRYKVSFDSLVFSMATCVVAIILFWVRYFRAKRAFDSDEKGRAS
ncbi:Predicted integral membrane protein [Trueperella bialowiezensis]|uniref:Predicted integral membrane protein n=2 Tax=Trueperella bialowiezensis TaxID=312285 RepID=A0A3S4VAK0_9ACTO|nr:Predicted integral membrane protein [Trueperella bialowiezensis]